MSDSGETAIQNAQNASRASESTRNRIRSGTHTGTRPYPIDYNCSVIRAREAIYQSRDVRNTWVSDSVPHTEHETHTPSYKESHFGNKIRLKRMGKKFYAFYRVVIMDSRTKRDGRAIEEIGTYNPNTQPSTININSERAQYWLGVGAQPTEQMLNLLKITGDWQKFKGLDGAEGTLKTVEAGPDAAARVEAVEAQAQKLKAAKSEADAKAKAEAEAAATEEAPAEEPAAEAE